MEVEGRDGNVGEPLALDPGAGWPPYLWGTLRAACFLPTGLSAASGLSQGWVLRPETPCFPGLHPQLQGSARSHLQGHFS